MTETSSAAAEEDTAGRLLAESDPKEAAGPPGVHQVGRRPSEDRALAAETPFLGVTGTVSRMFYYWKITWKQKKNTISQGFGSGSMRQKWPTKVEKDL